VRGGLVPTYRRRPSALHSARAGVTAAYCAALALAAVLYEHPLVLGALLCAIVAAGLAAGVGGELARAARLAVPIALLVALVNPLVSKQGLTLLVRGGELLGWRLDITLEATVYGLVAGLFVLVLVLAFGLFSATVDPDELLRAFRRVSYRSALTASLATRLVPILVRDAARMRDAARCRAKAPPRAAVARAALSGALERAVDVAAALEVRGYAGARGPAREARPWSRHDVRLAVAALAIAAVAIAGRALGAGSFEAYPRVSMGLGPPELLIASLLLALAVAPLAGAAARLGVGRA
jgi:energy-coupling factor transport system permease protein